jgi:hypothetical protein
MKNKIKIVSVVLVGLLMAGGIIFLGCSKPGENCIGTGECTITIKQGANGLSIDYDQERSDCGKGATWNSDQGKYTGGCQVNNMNSSWYQTSAMRAGTHDCDC